MSSSKVLKGVHQDGTWIRCAWDDCDRQGYELFKVLVHEHVGMACDEPGAEHIAFIFCTEKHKQYHLYSHIKYGAVAPGQSRV